MRYAPRLPSKPDSNRRMRSTHSTIWLPTCAPASHASRPIRICCTTTACAASSSTSRPGGSTKSFERAGHGLIVHPAHAPDGAFARNAYERAVFEQHVVFIANQRCAAAGGRRPPAFIDAPRAGDVDDGLRRRADETRYPGTQQTVDGGRID